MAADEKDSDLKAVLKEMTRRADAGTSLAQCFQLAGCFPEYLCTLLRIGQAVGKTEQTLAALSRDGVYTYYCAISDTQALWVVAVVDAEEYQILRWQAVSVTDWKADEKLHVWTGPEQ